MDKTKPYAVINNQTKIVENVIMWDGRTKPLEITAPEIIKDEEGNNVETGNLIVVEVIQPWMPPPNTSVICIEGMEGGIGWMYDGKQFIDVRFPDIAPEGNIIPETSE